MKDERGTWNDGPHAARKSLIGNTGKKTAADWPPFYFEDYARKPDLHFHVPHSTFILAARHSPLIPATRMTSSHLFCSANMSLPNSAELIFTIEPPCSSSRFWNSGVEMTSRVSAWKRAMMSAGVFGGAKMPHQIRDS